MNIKKYYRRAYGIGPVDSKLRRAATIIDSVISGLLSVWLCWDIVYHVNVDLMPVLIPAVVMALSLSVVPAVLTAIAVEELGLQQAFDGWYQLRLPIAFYVLLLGRYVAWLWPVDLSNPRLLIRVIDAVEKKAKAKRDGELTAIRTERDRLRTSVVQLDRLINRMESRIGQQGEELSEIRLAEAQQCRQQLAELAEKFSHCERTCSSQYDELEAVIADLRDKHALADELQTIADGRVQLKRSTRVLELVKADLAKIGAENDQWMSRLGDIRDERHALAKACVELGYSTDTHQEITIGR